MRTSLSWDSEPVAPTTVVIDTGCTQVTLPVGAGRVPVKHNRLEVELELNQTQVVVNAAGCNVTSEHVGETLRVTLLSTEHVVARREEKEAIRSMFERQLRRDPDAPDAPGGIMLDLGPLSAIFGGPGGTDGPDAGPGGPGGW